MRERFEQSRGERFHRVAQFFAFFTTLVRWLFRNRLGIAQEERFYVREVGPFLGQLDEPEAAEVEGFRPRGGGLRDPSLGFREPRR